MVSPISSRESIDPGARQWRELGPERAIYCIAYPAIEIEASGVIRHIYGDRFPLGEALGENGAMLALIIQRAKVAGLY